MNICQVVASHGKGGLEKHVQDLSVGLAERGHRVLVIAPLDFLRTLPETLEKQPMHAELSRYNPLLLGHLFFKLRASGCDVIHAQANKATSLVGSVGRFLPQPVVATLHNIKSNLRPFRRADHVITVSRQLMRPFDPAKSTVIYNGTRQAPVAERLNVREVFNLPPDRPVLLAVGRLVEAKGFDILLEAVHGLSLSLLIVGDGPEKEHLEKKIAQLPPQTLCRLTGYRADVADLMHGVDAVVIASRREGFSYVLSEALLCKSLVLSTDVPVANEVLPPELIVPVNDAQALREQLVGLLVDLPRWRSLMAPAWDFADKELQLSSMLDKTEALYRQMLETRLRA